ncbi:MAG: ABC transporter substrate-binding protein [Filomicrobium sp.]
MRLAIALLRPLMPGCGQPLILTVVVLSLLVLVGGPASVLAQGTTPSSNPDLDGAHFTIAVHTSSNGQRREPEAIRQFVKHRVAQINAAGGVLGRRLKARFFDDGDEEKNTIANVRETLKDPRLLAVVGIWSSSRGSFVVDAIGEAGVPFVSEMSVATLFSQYPNVYSMAHSVKAEVDVFLELAKRRKITRIAYAGFRDDLFTNAYLGHLIDTKDGPGIVSSFWESEATVIADYDKAIDDIVASRAELVVMALGSRLGARFLGRMAERGLTLPAFVSYGNIRSVLKSGEGADAYRGDIYELSTGGVANLNNERIESIARDLGVEVREDRGEGRSFNARQLAYGARYADLVEMVAQAAAGQLRGAGEEPPAVDRKLDDALQAVRARVTKEFGQLREGQRYWEGSAQYWTFSNDRSTSERALLLWRNPGQKDPVLFPRQFLHIDGVMKEVPVLYLHLDMVRMFEIDTNMRRFDAEFYLTLRSQDDLGLEAIDFTNAYRSSNQAAEPIRWKEVARFNDDIQSGLGPRRIYHVNGRFAFEPDLSKYPFDEQLATITFQPADSKSNFILQPPGADLRNRSFRVEDWRLISHYVGTTDRIITSIRGQELEEHVIPYYNFNYTWVMRREVIDYLVRVLVPLAFILIVAYLAAFIPRHEFNATVAIQVTALLSAIALYFALNQPNSDEVTLSDKIFVSAYAIVSLMIALSIFEVRESAGEDDKSRGDAMTTLRAVQIFAVPVVTFAVIGWLIASAATDRSIAEGIRETVRWGLLSFADFVGR